MFIRPVSIYYPPGSVVEVLMQALPPAELIEHANELLESYLDARFAGWDQSPSTVEAAQRLSEGFTRAPDELTPWLGQPTFQAAYLAYFVPRAIAATAHVIGPALRFFRPMHVVDVGAGTGGAAFICALAGAARLTLIDRDESALRIARQLLQQLPTPPSLDTYAEDVQETKRKALAADTLVSSFALGEFLNVTSPNDVLVRLTELAPAATRWIFVDAGDRHRARGLQTLRQTVLDAGYKVLAPCPHDDICPALSRTKDWCHTRVPRWLRPRLAEFARRVGRDETQMNLSYLVVERQGVTSPATPSNTLRVIGTPIREKGRVRLPVCGPQGTRFVQSMKRFRVLHDRLITLDRGARFSLAGAALRGDTLHVENRSDVAPATTDMGTDFP